MKTPTNLCRGTTAALTAVLLTVPALSAPKKPESAPATEQQPAPKKSSAAKQKSSPDPTKKQEGAAPAVEPKVSKTRAKATATESVKPVPNAATAAAKKAKSNTAPVVEKAAGTKADSNPEAASAAPPEKKKGFLKRVFGGKKEAEDQAAEPALAKAKTAKPVPVKDLKPVKPVPSVAAAAAPATVEEPKKKRGFLGFLRGDRTASQGNKADSTVPEFAKIERPGDWHDHRIVKEETVGLYEFGPAQSNGPDTRLERGTMVILKRVEKGWALVQTTSGRSGYIDAASLRDAVEGDFAAPVVKAMATASVNPQAWAPAAPPPDLPDHPASLDSESGLLLLPPLELEPKKKPATAQ